LKCLEKAEKLLKVRYDVFKETDPQGTYKEKKIIVARTISGDSKTHEQCKKEQLLKDK
jgi:hypothetical protein